MKEHFSHGIEARLGSIATTSAFGVVWIAFASTGASCAAVHDGIRQPFERFTQATVQGDDEALEVLEYAGA